MVLNLWLAFSFLATAQEESRVSLQWRTNSNQIVVEVVGLDTTTLRVLQETNLETSAWQKLFSVYVSQGLGVGDAAMPSMLGNYSIQEETIRFTPRFPLQRGVSYRAVFRPANLTDVTDKSAAEVVSTFRMADMQQQPTTAVSNIYPSADVLPENLLKFYVQFSAPMQGGGIYEHIHLLDDRGKAMDLPFLELAEELWDPEMTRLTLFIDPGRIKRGVKPLEDIGPTLEKGKRYTLVIDSAWMDGSGVPLRESHRKPFRVGAADRKPPNPAKWKIRSPKAGTWSWLIVDFGEPMDHALALRLIQVADAEGRIVEGASILSDGDRQWGFVPAKEWSSGKYQLQVQNTIEDLAGNNIGKTFDVDLAEGAQRRFTKEVVKLMIEVR